MTASGGLSQSTSSSKSKTFQFDFTDLEQELQGVNMEIVMQGIASLANQYGFQEAAYSLMPELISQLNTQFKQTPEQLARQEAFGSAQDELLQIEMDRIRSGGAATEEQKRLINESTEAQIDRGSSDIAAFGQQQLDIIKDQLAPSRGLRPSDTPIQDRGFLLGGELARQQGNLVSDLRGQQAQAELNFPLAANQANASLSQFQQQLGESAGQFQSQLQQQAFSNRLNLFGQIGQAGLGLVGSTQPFSQLQETFRPQLGTESSSKARSNSANFSGGISSRAIKTNLRPVDDNEILERLVAIPVKRWVYVTSDTEDHIGTFAEDFAENFGVGNGITINYLDAIGVLMSGVKALARRVEELEGGS